MHLFQSCRQGARICRSVTVERRKRGPAVWCFRWREAGPGGRRIHRRIVLGTADELRSIASARKMVVGLRHEINVNDIRVRRESITVADLSGHYRQRELADRNVRISYSTKRAYRGYLEKWIDPRWGEYKLMKVRAVEVESWLKSLTRSKIRNVMSLLFNHGRRYELCDRNPIQWVRQSAKRRVTPDILTRDEVHGLLANPRFRELTLVLLAVTTGLRRSELFALKWQDVDFQTKQIYVTRSIVQNVIGICKTESSQKPVPAHDELVEALREWRCQTPYPAGRTEPENYESTRLAYFSSYLFDAASLYWCGTEDHAGTAASFNDSRHARYVHASGHNRETQCPRGSCRALVPRKNAGSISSA